MTASPSPPVSQHHRLPPPETGTWYSVTGTCSGIGTGSHASSVDAASAVPEATPVAVSAASAAPPTTERLLRAGGLVRFRFMVPLSSGETVLKRVL